MVPKLPRINGRPYAVLMWTSISPMTAMASPAHSPPHTASLSVPTPVPSSPLALSANVDTRAFASRTRRVISPKVFFPRKVASLFEFPSSSSRPSSSRVRPLRATGVRIHLLYFSSCSPSLEFLSAPEGDSAAPNPASVERRGREPLRARRDGRGKALRPRRSTPQYRAIGTSAATAGLKEGHHLIRTRD